MNAGSITFSTELDNKELESQFSSLKKKIIRQEDEINRKQASRAPLADQSQQLAIDLDAAKARLDYMKSRQETLAPESITQQTETVNALQAQWTATQTQVERYDTAISKATTELNYNKEKAGAIAQELSNVEGNTDTAGKATERASRNMGRFALRVREVVRSALVFTIITQALAKFREWVGSVITSNAEASASVARLKAALLTLAQPLVSVIIPAFTAFVNVLADIVTQIAKIVSYIFGTTLSKSKQSAEALYKQTKAINSTGTAAKKAAKENEKYLASFDEINQIGGKNSDSGSTSATDTSGITPDFSSIGEQNWLKDRLGESAGMVSAGLILGGIALIAIGAALGSLATVVSGLLLVSSGIYVADDTGILPSWIKTLGLNSVEDFKTVAAVLGGIAITAIGAALGNIWMVIAGLGLIGTTIVYSEKSGQMEKWYNSLGLDKAAEYVTAALLVGGIVLIAFGAALKNFKAVVAGILMLGAGIVVGTESGTIQNWWDALHLPQYAQWITPALILGGIALIVFAIVMKNIMMLIGGFALLSAGINFGIQSGTFEKWWEVLCLPQVANWVETALLLGGIGLLVIGIATGNLPMLLFGLGLLGTAITFGITSGTFSRWIDDIKTGLSNGWSDIKNWWKTSVAPKLTLQFWHDQFDNIRKGLVEKIRDAISGGIALFNQFIDWVNEKLNISWDPVVIAGKTIIQGGSFQLFTIPHIPALAEGAVIPPNREFLAMLGDQKSGTNIEAPESLIRRIVREESGSNGAKSVTVIMEVDKREFGRVIYNLGNDETQRVGVRLLT